MNVLVTGGAGFIGSNLVASLMNSGHHVRILDNLSRRGVAVNLKWLQSLRAADDRLEVVIGDVREPEAVADAALGAEAIIHLAAQVAVTTSVVDPTTDFDVNARGTLNVLEAARKSDADPVVVFTSTNKVYGGMEDARIIERDTRYEYADVAYRGGVDEGRPLDFHSPYGCSKGAADQYVHDYHRIYGLRTTVFRMSCIYGPHQFGNEDQGWVAHFLIAAVLGLPVTIYGDGKQVRDVLFVGDLVRAFQLVLERPERATGRVYNVGGGPEQSISIWNEFRRILDELGVSTPRPTWGTWRPGDQLVYVSNTSRIKEELGWTPLVSPRSGIDQLYRWIRQNQQEISSTLGVSLAG